jgi:hypothetical protein
MLMNVGIDQPVCYAMLYRIHQYRPPPIFAVSTLVVSIVGKRSLRLPSHLYKLMLGVWGHMIGVGVIIARWN